MPEHKKISRHLQNGKNRAAQNWAAGIGLQAVDGLEPSAYLVELARMNIEGEIDASEAQRLAASHHEKNAVEGKRTREADLAAANIALALGESSFMAAPGALFSIHREIFANVFGHAGRPRDYNFMKKEWVLDGDTAAYADFADVPDILSFEFDREKRVDYRKFSKLEAARRAAFFISSIWQAHPFCEGNTRAAAVFLIKYLRKKGFSPDNRCFLDNSPYFRNALARSCYENRKLGVKADMSYLEKFFENLIAGQKHELENRFLHINAALPRKPG